jgi:hypothetical protein
MLQEQPTATGRGPDRKHGGTAPRQHGRKANGPRRAALGKAPGSPCVSVRQLPGVVWRRVTKIEPVYQMASHVCRVKRTAPPSGNRVCGCVGRAIHIHPAFVWHARGTDATGNPGSPYGVSSVQKRGGGRPSGSDRPFFEADVTLVGAWMQHAAGTPQLGFTLGGFSKRCDGASRCVDAMGELPCCRGAVATMPRAERVAVPG